MTAMLPAHLSDTINNLGSAAGALTEEIRADRAQRDVEYQADRVRERKRSRAMLALLAANVVLVLTLVGMAVVNRGVFLTIQGCTTESGECARKGRAQTAAAIRQLIDMQVEIEACGKTETTDVGYRACVEAARLRVAGMMPTPAPKVTPSPSVGFGPSPTPATIPPPGG